MKKYLYLGKEYELAIRLAQKEIVEISDKIYLGIPNSKKSETYLLSWYRNQARKVITKRVYLYANHFKLHPSSVTVGNLAATTRWGSCSSKKNLNFNWKLIMAPIEAIDYVVVHELAHLTELNHSRAFWENVRKMFPIFREQRTWFRRNGDLLKI